LILIVRGRAGLAEKCSDEADRILRRWIAHANTLQIYGRLALLHLWSIAAHNLCMLPLKTSNLNFSRSIFSKRRLFGK